MLKPRGTFKPKVYVVQPCPKNFPHPSRRLHTGSYGHALRRGFSGLSKGGVSQPLRPCTACVQTGLDVKQKDPKKVPTYNWHLFPRSISELEGFVLASVCFILHNGVELQCYAATPKTTIRNSKKSTTLRWAWRWKMITQLLWEPRPRNSEMRFGVKWCSAYGFLHFTWT